MLEKILQGTEGAKTAPVGSHKSNDKQADIAAVSDLPRRQRIAAAGFTGNGSPLPNAVHGERLQLHAACVERGRDHGPERILGGLRILNNRALTVPQFDLQSRDRLGQQRRCKAIRLRRQLRRGDQSGVHGRLRGFETAPRVCSPG